MKIYDFPDIGIKNQLFYTSGQAFDGGFTSGGAQLVTPDPGGFGTLEIEPELSAGEWIDPAASWLMSKGAGAIMRVRMHNSPQLSWTGRRRNALDPNRASRGIDGEGIALFSGSALEGSTTVTVDLSRFGKILRRGHVIGHRFSTYLVDEISYSGTTAAIKVDPPLRANISVNDECLLTPWFTGRIANVGNIRSPYNSSGHVKLGNIVLQEAVV